jgi:hypothetical protein
MIKMKERKQYILNKKLGQLANYEPPSKVWDNIDKELQFEEGLETTLKHLPAYTPNEKIWESISLVTRRRKIVGLQPYIRTIIWTSTAIAASVMAIFLINNIWLEKGEKITYSEEIVYEEKVPVQDSLKEQMALKFIKEQCLRNETACSSTDFRDKLQELQKIDKELGEIYAVQIQLGSSTALTTSEIKLTNLRCLLIKELINYLNS